MYKIMQKVPSNQHPNITSTSPPNPQKYIQAYIIDYGKIIGKGNYSTVYPAINKNKPGLQLAVKIVNINNMRQQKIQKLLQNQIDILLSVHHSNVISCKDIFIDDHWCYLMTQFCEGGNLETKLIRSGIIPQQKSLKIIKNVFDGLLYLEKNHIIHRDIKVANIFLKENGDAVIADFGFACTINQPFHSINIGSLPFMAPQSIINNYYTEKNDVWSFGVFIYQLFHGQSPYARSHTIQELHKKVLVPLTLQQMKPELSIAMKQLIVGCLQINADKRPSFSDIQESWYFKQLFCQNHLSPLKAQKAKDFRFNQSLNKGFSPLSFTLKKTEFKSILEEIHYCRTLFKLISRLQAVQTKRKQVFANYSYHKILKILELIENDEVNYGLGNSQSRKKKLKTVAQDYAYEFSKEMRRKDIEKNSEECNERQVRDQLQKTLTECNTMCKNVELKQRMEMKKNLIRQLLSFEKENLKRNKK